MRNLKQSKAFSRSQIGLSQWSTLCQGLSRTTIGVPPFGTSANIAWSTCRDNGWGVKVDADTIIPAGSIVYYSSKVGFKGFDPSWGHATFCVKGGTVDTAVVVSNDVGPGKSVGAVHPSWFKQHWNMSVRGYIVECPHGPLPIKDGAAPQGQPEQTEQQPEKPDAKPDEQSVPAVLAPEGVHLATLKPGTSGPEVVLLQEALIAHGFAIPAGATGFYKDQTIAAVQAAQLAVGQVGPEVDGEVGRKVCKLLGLTVLD